MPIIETFADGVFQLCPLCLSWLTPFDGKVCGQCITRMRSKDVKIAPGAIPTEAQKRHLAEHLRKEAELRGYKPGWAAHKYKEIIGDWPPTPTQVRR